MSPRGSRGYKKGQVPWNKGLKGFMKGRIVSEESRRKIGRAQMGSKNHNWKGGITPESQRKGYKDQDWRNTVIFRDRSACQICKKMCAYPIAHHIKNKADFPHLKYELENGKTVCYDCHMIIHNKVSYYRKRGEFREPLEIEKTLSQVWEEISRKVQRILDETKEFYSIVGNSSKSASHESEHIC